MHGEVFEKNRLVWVGLEAAGDAKSAAGRCRLRDRSRQRRQVSSE